MSQQNIGFTKIKGRMKLHSRNKTLGSKRHPNNHPDAPIELKKSKELHRKSSWINKHSNFLHII